MLAAYCDDPTVSKARSAVWAAEGAIVAESVAVIEGETFAERQARVLAAIATKPARVAAAQAALEQASASRPLPAGWGDPGSDEKGTRLVLDMLCVAQPSD